MNNLKLRLAALALLVFYSMDSSALPLSAPLDETSNPMGPNTLWQIPLDCGHMGVWDIAMAMCMPLPMPGMPMKMLMLRGNAFGSRIWQTGPRGRSASASSNWVMADLGTSVGENHYLNVEWMLTAERWTFPYSGYPLLLQIGEQNSEGVPFIDAQHPHSSPLMGITFSDTIFLGQNKDHLKLFFAPRGGSTDGPVAFMHRSTALVQPDAPLGHHIGQDVGHISSTVLGASLKWGDQRFEGSLYHGTEPKPDQIDLPLGRPDSFSLRYVREFSSQWMAMASFARVNSSESDSADAHEIQRYSASVYSHLPLSSDWIFQNSLIYGLITHLDATDSLSSFTEEFLFRGEKPRIWGRVEVLQRTAAQLNIPTQGDPNLSRWVAALTLGYSHRLFFYDGAEVALGGSVTHTRVPSEWNSAYGGDAWTGKIYLQLGGMRMWDL